MLASLDCYFLVCWLANERLVKVWLVVTHTWYKLFIRAYWLLRKTFVRLFIWGVNLINSLQEYCCLWEHKIWILKTRIPKDGLWENKLACLTKFEANFLGFTAFRSGVKVCYFTNGVLKFGHRIKCHCHEVQNKLPGWITTFHSGRKCGRCVWRLRIEFW